MAGGVRLVVGPVGCFVVALVLSAGATITPTTTGAVALVVVALFVGLVTAVLLIARYARSPIPLALASIAGVSLGVGYGLFVLWALDGISQIS